MYLACFFFQIYIFKNPLAYLYISSLITVLSLLFQNLLTMVCCTAVVIFLVYRPIVRNETYTSAPSPIGARRIKDENSIGKVASSVHTQRSPNQNKTNASKLGKKRELITTSKPTVQPKIVKTTPSVVAKSAKKDSVAKKTTIPAKLSTPPPQDKNAADLKTQTSTGNISIVMRFASVPKLKTQFYCMFLRTMVFFWPQSYGALNIVLDDESKKDHEFGDKFKKQLKANFPGISLNVYYEPLPKRNILSFPGAARSPTYNRQLWSTFFADKYTTDPYIAYMDTDTQFVTPITKEYIGLTNGGKLLVLAEGTFLSWVYGWDKATVIALGLPTIANFMITFPQFLHRSTYENTRKHILNHTKTTDFEIAFSKFYKAGTALSPICVLLTYAWFHEHDKYEWHIKTKDPGAIFNNNRLPLPNKITPNELIPSIVGTSHISDKKAWQQHIMTPGYCMATKAAGMNIKGCKDIKHDPNLICDYWETFFRYRWPNVKTWCKAGTFEACCNEAVEKHYKDVARHYKDKMFDFDKNNIYKVEKMAKEVGISCPHTNLP